MEIANKNMRQIAEITVVSILLYLFRCCIIDLLYHIKILDKFGLFLVYDTQTHLPPQKWLT